MSFFEHLVDLRKRLINSAIAICVGAFIGVSVSQKVFGFIALPMRARRCANRIWMTVWCTQARRAPST